MRQYYVYIMANRTKTLYVGVTNDLAARVGQHKSRSVPGFTARYHLSKLVHAEATGDVRAAIAREKQLKGWRRSKEVALIEEENPQWDDLAEGWFADGFDARNNEDLPPQ